MNYKGWKISGVIATGVIVVMIPLSILIHGPADNRMESRAVFVGGKACIDCHQPEYDLWKGSDHDNAMDYATDESVLGDFNNAEFKHKGRTHKFYKRDDKFWVYTEGPKGEMEEFQVAYTFGIRPLQQYLIPFTDGKYQCLPIAWDTEKERWYHLASSVYSDEEIAPNNWLYWTNQGQNWNGMCAECHSTNLRKNFDAERKSFNTTWTDIDVNCETCHGPGSKHLEWANLPEMARSHDNNMGLIVRTSDITSKQLVELCAPCHSRRSSLGVYDHNNYELMNNAVPQLPNPPLYHVDGQILEEVYVYGSFTQSKMYMKDVMCSDCHDSHSIKFKYDGNALCTQCHIVDQYDTYDHHFHKYPGEEGNAVTDKFGEKIEVGEGSECMKCHMPGNYYMGVDFRRDHSFRIPRPDMSIELGTPNACNDCHADKSAQWSKNYINKWYGEKRKPHYSAVFADASQLIEGTDTSLVKIIINDLYPEIIRASAVEYISEFRNDRSEAAIRSALNDPEPIVRYTAVSVYDPASESGLINDIVPLLNDPVKAVRMQAASLLVRLNFNSLNELQKRAYDNAIIEYEDAMKYTADFPTGRFNLGNLYSNLGRTGEAIDNYNEALKLDNLFYPAKVNLALFYYNNNQPEKAEDLFLDLAENHPEFNRANYYLGLLYAEQRKYEHAADRLELAAAELPENGRIYYNLGLIYQYLDDSERALESLMKAYKTDENNFDFIYALIDYHIKRGNLREARHYGEELRSKFPDNPQVGSILDYLNNLTSQ